MTDEIISKDEGSEMAKPTGKLARTSGLYYHWSSTLGWFTVSAESRATEGDQETPRDIDYIKVVSKIYEEKSLLETCQCEICKIIRLELYLTVQL